MVFKRWEIFRSCIVCSSCFKFWNRFFDSVRFYFRNHFFPFFFVAFIRLSFSSFYYYFFISLKCWNRVFNSTYLLVFSTNSYVIDMLNVWFWRSIWTKFRLKYIVLNPEMLLFISHKSNHWCSLNRQNAKYLCGCAKWWVCKSQRNFFFQIWSTLKLRDYLIITCERIWYSRHIMLYIYIFRKMITQILHANTWDWVAIRCTNSR